MNVDGEKTMVADLLKFKLKMQTIVQKCCADDTQRFNDTVKDAFSVFINQRQNKPAEMIGESFFSKIQNNSLQLNTWTRRCDRATKSSQTTNLTRQWTK